MQKVCLSKLSRQNMAISTNLIVFEYIFVLIHVMTQSDVGYGRSWKLKRFLQWSTWLISVDDRSDEPSRQRTKWLIEVNDRSKEPSPQRSTWFFTADDRKKKLFKGYFEWFDVERVNGWKWFWRFSHYLCIMGFWNCNVSNTCPEFLMILNVLFHCFQFSLWFEKTVLFGILDSVIRGFWSCHQRSERVCYPLHFHKLLKGWLCCSFFYQCGHVHSDLYEPFVDKWNDC